MNRCVAVAEELAARIVAEVADLDRNTAEAIKTEHTRAAVASVNVDHIGVVVAPSTVTNTLRISKTRWIFRVSTSLTLPARLDWT